MLFFSSRGRHTRCAVVSGVQTCALPICRRARWVAALDADRDARLQALAARFLRDKAITPVGDLELDAAARTLLAAVCCLPLLEFGEQGLHGWTQLIVYPDAFRVNRSHVDAAGVLHEWEDDLIGESWESGPLILSWADVQADLDEPDAGFCVAVHEMAHELDALDGVLDGTPPLPRAWQREWARDFQAAFDTFARPEEHTSELQSLMRISYAVFCLKKKTNK